MRLIAVLVIVFVAVEARPNRTKEKKEEWSGMLRPISESDSLHKQEWEDLQAQRNGEPYDKVYDPCDDVKCGHSKICLVLEDYSATCVSKHSVKHGDKLYDRLIKDDDKPCSKCPIVHPYFVCGSDGNTYADQCHLDRKACKTGKTTTKLCDGRCPCTSYEEVAVELKPGYYQDYVQEPLDVWKDTIIAADNELPEGNALDAPQQIQYTDDIAQEGDWAPVECTDFELTDLPRRLIEWFRLLQDDEQELYKKNPHKETPIPDVEILPKCKAPSAWMFITMDTDRDLILTSKEYNDLYNDEYEVCMKPFIDQCDINKDWKISGEEWCNCFHGNEEVKPPCYDAMDQVPTMLIMGEPNPLPGAFIPACDNEGYYTVIQCHGSTGFCWCVDKYGIEYENTRVRGEPPCDEIFDDTDDYEDEEGSGNE